MVDSKHYGEDELLMGAGVTAAIPYHSQLRRKGIGTKEWLFISETGQTQLQVAGKHSIMRRTGLPARDLRILDPALSYPSTILGRERAIVVNLEHIKAIVTAKEVLMINSSNPLVVDFATDLQQRIVSEPNGNGGLNQVMENKEATDEDQNKCQHLSKEQMNIPGFKPCPTPKILPFEFKALEACLESACKCLENQTCTLELEAYPALDELTSKISTLNLERVRHIKSRLVALSGRVQKVRDELEHLVDDDNDMFEMYLTEKLNGQAMENKEQSNASDTDDDDDDRSVESKSDRGSSSLSGFKPNVVELEMLLEAYFAQVDGISQKLSTMSEYVDDTEDYINIMLDDKQNQLLQMGVMLSTAIMVLNAGIVVVGLFGMNINISLYSGTNLQFWETTIGTVVGCIVLYLIAYGWGKKMSLFGV